MTRPRWRARSTVSVLGDQLIEHSCLMWLADSSNVPKMGNKLEGKSRVRSHAYVICTNGLGTGNTMGATNTGTTSYDSTAHDTNMGDTMRTTDNYGSTTAGMCGSGSHGAGGQLDSSKMASGMPGTVII